MERRGRLEDNMIYGDDERPLDPPDNGWLERCASCDDQVAVDFLADGKVLCPACRRRLLLAQEELDKSRLALDRIQAEIDEFKKLRIARRQA
jgi:DNA-directed RNA polymerase subunit RPC12/RpoP